MDNDRRHIPNSPAQSGFGSKLLPAAFSLLTVAVVLSPIVENWRSDPEDSFPLSYYPMFTRCRNTTTRLTYLVAVDDRGQARPLNYRWAGSGGMNQVRKQLRKIAREGAAEHLCRRVARRLAARHDGPNRPLSVCLVTGQFRVADVIARRFTPVSLEIDGRAEVETR